APVPRSCLPPLPEYRAAAVVSWPQEVDREYRVGFDHGVVDALAPKAELIEREHRTVLQCAGDKCANLRVAAGQGNRDLVARDTTSAFDQPVVGGAQLQPGAARVAVELCKPVDLAFLPFEIRIEGCEPRRGRPGARGFGN